MIRTMKVESKDTAALATGACESTYAPCAVGAGPAWVRGRAAHVDLHANVRPFPLRGAGSR